MKKCLTTLVLAATCCGVANAADIPLKNWPVPRFSHTLSTLGDIGAPTPFIPISPCRIVDTRGGAPLGGGVGPFTNAVSRAYDLNSAGAPCNGIPAGTTGYSINVTVTNNTGPGYIAVYPTGAPPSPLVSLLNYTTASAVANSTIVPCDSSGSITVLDGGGTTDVIIDINGYFSATPAAGTDAFRIYTNNSSFAGVFSNSSLTCNATCGLFASADSNMNGAIALSGVENSTSGSNTGIYGNSYGIGGTFNSSTPGTLLSGYSAGVVGSAASTTTNVAGVWGKTTSSAAWAAGVVGTSTQANANAALFQNSGGPTPTYVEVCTNGVGVYTNGSIGGAAITGTSLSISGSPKNFVAPHPLDPTKEIVYAAIEGPSADVFFRGTGHLANGAALIQVPDHFRLTARDDSYTTTVTAVGARSILWVESEGPEGIVVRGAGDATFHYVVYAERDETRDQQAVRDNVHFTPDALVGKTGILQNLPEKTRAILVKNGILNSDMTVNTRTAERYGWKVPTE